MLDTRTVVRQQIDELLIESRSLTGAEQLHELGITSLLLARLVVHLEQELGIDPFEEDVAISDVRSVDDLIAAYDRSLPEGGQA